MELYVLFLIIIPIIAAFLIPLIDIIYKKGRKILVVTATAAELLITFLLIVHYYNPFFTGGLSVKYFLGGWFPSVGITLNLDSIGLLFSSLVSICMFLIIIYSIGFIGHHEGKYYVLIFLLMGSMQGAVLTGDIFNLYVFIELITITSAALVSFKRNREGTEAALKYAIYGVIAGLFFLIGVFLIYFNLGSLNMEIIAANFANVNMKMQVVIIIFFLSYIFRQMGVFPFHFWRPKAYSASPAPVSALLSGILAKVYICIFLRIFWEVTVSSPVVITNLKYFIFYLSLLSSTIGHLLALREDNIKRLLAFSSIGHIGIIIAAFIINTGAGLYGGMLHVVNHLLMKTTLFIITGYLLQYTQSPHIADFNGVAYKNQGIFVSFIVSALAMVGIPPLPGFFSKFYIIKSFLEVGHYPEGFLIILLSFISLFYYLRYILRGYSMLDYERGIKPRKVGLVLSVFYRERIVTDVAYVFTILLVLSGVFYWVLTKPLMVVVQDILGG